MPVPGASTLTAPDGTALACRRVGTGEPLILLPGGPMRSSAYLDGLPDLCPQRESVLLDLRGTGASAVPSDPSSFRCDRQVDDVEALRVHLGRDRLDLLAHSAGASLAVLYAARYPEHVGHLVLIAPSPRVVGVDVTDDDRRHVAGLRRGQPWFEGAIGAFERIWSGAARDEDWAAITPFMHGRWDEARAVEEAAAAAQQNPEAVAAYYGPGVPPPAVTRAALGALHAPVLVLAGELDVALPPPCAARCARLFPRAELAVLPGAGHTPWLDDPVGVAGALRRFLD